MTCICNVGFGMNLSCPVHSRVSDPPVGKDSSAPEPPGFFKRLSNAIDSAMDDHTFGPLDEDAELCAKCGFTRYNHIGNTGLMFPCWEPSGKFSEGRNINHPTPCPPQARPFAADDVPTDPSFEDPKRELENAFWEYADWRADSTAGTTKRSFSHSRIGKARAALSRYIAQQREEIAEWRKDAECNAGMLVKLQAKVASLQSEIECQQAKLQAIEDVAESYVNTDDGDHANWVSIMGGMIDETRKCMDEARAELERQRETTLTPEERDYLLHVLPKVFTNMVDLPALITKLRASLPTPTSDVK